MAKGEVLPFERLKEPVMAVNTLGSLVGNLISQRTLALIYTRRPLLNCVTDFTDQKARLGQTVYTRTIGLPTVQTFGTAPTAASVVDYPVTLKSSQGGKIRVLGIGGVGNWEEPRGGACGGAIGLVDHHSFHKRGNRGRQYEGLLEHRPRMQNSQHGGNAPNGSQRLGEFGCSRSAA